MSCDHSGKGQSVHRFVYGTVGNLKEIWTSRDSVEWVLESWLWYPDFDTLCCFEQVEALRV